MSGQLNRSPQQFPKRSHPFVSRRVLGESEATRCDFSPSGVRVASPSTGKSILSPYVSIKHESVHRLRTKAKPSPKSRFEALNRSSSCLQSSPKRAKSSAKLKSDIRLSVTPKAERNTANSRLLTSSKLASVALESEEDDLEQAEMVLEELISVYPQLAETLKTVRVRYERRIEQVSEELEACKHIIALQKKELEAGRMHVEQLKGDMKALEAIEYTEITENCYKKQNEILLKVLNNLSTRGYPVQTAYIEIQKDISTADSGDSPMESKPWDRPHLVPRLKLPQEQQPDFQAEFFAKLEEFSESWKVQVPKAHH